MVTEKEKAIIRLKNYVGHQVRLKSSIIKKAQNYTGLKSSDPEVLLRNAEKVYKQKWKQYYEKARRDEKEKDKAHAKHFRFSYKEYKRLKDKALEIAEHSMDPGYSMGSIMKVFIKGYEAPFATYSSIVQYAGKWRGYERHGRTKFTFTKKELRNIQNIEGVWTIVKEGNKAKWLEPSGYKNDFSVKWVEGYLFGTSHGITKGEALALQRSKEKAFRGKYTDKDFIGKKDIIALGACWPGIKSFCQRHNLNPEYGYNIGYLKSLGGPGTTYFNKMTSNS